MSCERTKFPTFCTLYDLSISLRSDTFNFKSIATLTSAFTPTRISVTTKDPKLFSKLISTTARGLLQTSFRQSTLRFQQFIHTSVIMSKYNVIFVLGGPGAGKGTQCEMIVKEFGFVHLSAGDLLRAERQRKGSKYGELIEGHITAGTIVPVEITCALLKQAMEDSGKTHFLIDGFPRNKDNLDGWNKEMSEVSDVKQVLFFDCKEEVCVDRCLNRGKTSGRSDDNLESLKKRITTYNNSTRPIIEHYDTLKLVTQLDGEKTPEDVFKDVTKALTDLKLAS